MHYTTKSNILHVSHPLPDDKWRVAKLWQEVFDDSPEFIDLFFSRVYKPENTFVIRREQEIISSLQVVPYDFKIDDETVPSAYICGVCTASSERGRGLMKMLMNEALEELKKRGYPLAVVIPAERSLFNLYKRFGFEYPVYQRFHVYNSYDLTMRMNSVISCTFEPCTIEHFPCFDRLQHKRKRILIHNEYDFETILQDFMLDGGYPFVAIRNNNPTGIAFAKRISNKKAIIKDIFSDNRPVYNLLCKHTFKFFGVSEVRVRRNITCMWNQVDSNLYGLICKLDNEKINLNFLNMSLMLD